MSVVTHSAIDALRAEVEALREVCAQAYQLAGAAGAPVRALDVLAAAADGRPLPHDGEFLPLAPDDFSEVRELRDELVVLTCLSHGDAMRRLSAPALRLAADDIRAFDAPLAAYLSADADRLAPLDVSDMRRVIADWMATRR